MYKKIMGITWAKKKKSCTSEYQMIFKMLRCQNEFLSGSNVKE